MIEVTLGEVKPPEIPFPKLMVSDLGQMFLMLGVNEDHDDCLIGVELFSNGYRIGGNGFSKQMDRRLFKDYNGTVTIQNLQ